MSKYDIFGVGVTGRLNEFVQSGFYDFKAKSDDIFLVAFPKTGTTWLQELIYLITSDLDFTTAKTKTITERFPDLDQMKQTHGENWLQNEASRTDQRLYKSHFPLYFLPPSIYEVNPKIVHCVRNIKDTIVSSYHFFKGFTDSFRGVSEDKFPDFPTYVEMFLNDDCICGPFWKVELTAWEKRHDPNFFYVRYEDMKKDLASVVRRLAEFLGKHLTEQQVSEVVKHCTFSSMKDNKAANRDFLTEQGITRENYKFMRKGEVGDWRNHFTEELNDKVKSYLEQHLEGTGLILDYED